MKSNNESLKKAMDRRLAFLDDLPSCRSAVMYRIAQEEEPVMKRKISAGLIFAMVLTVLSVAALAAGLLLSPRVTAAQLADQALEKQYGITAEMQTFFFREEEELTDGTVRVTYTGAGEMKYALGTYTAQVKNGKAEISWSHDGEDTSGGYDAKAWGLEQITRMMSDSIDPQRKAAYLAKAEEIGKEHEASEENAPSEAIDNYFEIREAEKTEALNRRVLSEKELIGIGRDFIVSNYGLNAEQQERMELYTGSSEEEGNGWYEMIHEKPCLKVEYLLYHEEEGKVDPANRTEMDGYYIVYVNVETGSIEEYEYNSALAGQG